MEGMMEQLLGVFHWEKMWFLLRLVVLVAVGIFVGRLMGALVGRLVRNHATAQQTMLLQRAAFYGIVVLVVIAALQEMGFDLRVLLGAAGLLTVALGFASQTSASNVISGLFLIGERPFVVGDLIRVGETTGFVVSIDLVSVKLRTFDNLYVRVPNESIFKSQIVNLTHYPVRRLDIPLSVLYRENLGRVREILLNVARQMPMCLDEPAPMLMFLGFGDSAVKLQFSVWTTRENFLPLRSMVQEAIKVAFDEAGIAFPFPHRTLYLESGEAVKE